MNLLEGDNDILRDTDGTPMLDRYGRPIRSREEQQQQQQRQQPVRRPRRDTTTDRPRQYMPSPYEQQQQQYYQPPSPPQPPQRPQRRSQQPQPRPRKRRRNPVRGCMTGFAWLLIIVLVLGIAGTFWLDGRLNRVEAEPAQHVANTSGTNWLLVGSDSRTGLSDEDAQRLGTGGDIGSMRTDTIMLLHIPTTGKATLVSLPRDSYVNIPGYGMDKINAAFTFGGPPLLTQTVEESTGLHVDHYAEIGMGGLANVVDAVGGIEVCPAEPIEDPLANLNIQAGCQKVDGPTALGYVRTRATAMGDLDRVQRQREFFSTLVKKVSSAGTLANPFRILPTINTVTGSFTVGNKDHVWNLARVALAMRGGITTETVPVGGFGNYDVGSVVLWDEAGSQQLFNSLK